MNRSIIVFVLIISMVLCLFGCTADKVPSYSPDGSAVSGTGDATSTPDDVVIPDNSGDDKQTDNGASDDNGQNSADENRDETDADNSDTTVNDKENDNSSGSDDKEDDKPATEDSTVCYHTNTEIADAYDATCTKMGYTGDEVCTECGEIVKSGDYIFAAGHSNVVLENRKEATCTQTGYSGDSVCKVCNQIVVPGGTIEKEPHDEIVVGYIEPTLTSEGYTGNTVCSVCNTVISYGKAIAKLEQQYHEITIHDALGKEYVVTYPYGVDPWEYTSKLANKSATHSDIELEKRILELLNEERAKVGLAPLEWDESGYYYTKIRATESIEYFSHTRPNGEHCFSVYYNDNVYAEQMGENLYRGVNLPEEFDWAQMAVDGWMNSPGHRENVLYPNYTKCAIAFVQIGDTFVIAHHFYG